MRIPFCPMPPKKVNKLVGHKLYGLVEPILRLSPSLEIELDQVGYEMNARDYVSIAFFSAFFMFGLMFFLFSFITGMILDIFLAMTAGFFIGLAFFFITLLYIIIYPQLLVKKKLADIERNILYALRHMYVQITSGVSLFEAMGSVAQGNYGQMSEEFGKAIKMVNTGVSMENALEELTLRNPSIYFRRAMWQISNGVKSGSDIGGIMRNIMEYVAAEQKILIRRYGAQLNPLTVAYMMIAVIVPSLGVTFLMVVSSFAKIPVTETMFWGILGFVTLFQFMFMGILKSKRPNLM